MKNSNYIINGILLVAVIVLFILQFTGRRSDTKHLETGGLTSDSTGFHLPIAYVQTDSLLLNYKFLKDLSESQIKKVEDKKLNINQRRERLANEIVKFQEKAQYNAFISEEKQMQERNRLEGQQRDLDNYITQVERELTLEQQKINQQLQDTIITALKQFNTPKKYEMILSNSGTDNILYADDLYDITNEVIEFLNARYVPPKK